MKIAEVRTKAKALGLKAAGKKADLIRSIQGAEGNPMCFGTRSECWETECCWRDDCLPKSK